MLKEPNLDYLLHGTMGRLGIIPFKESLLDTFENGTNEIKRLDFNSICYNNNAAKVFGSAEPIPVSL